LLAKPALLMLLPAVLTGSTPTTPDISTTYNYIQSFSITHNDTLRQTIESLIVIDYTSNG